jgi:excisionase family DNA binding protein
VTMFVPSFGDRLLTVDEAAEQLTVSRKWLYRHAKTLPFTKRLSAKTIRFSERGLRSWLAQQGPTTATLM